MRFRSIGAERHWQIRERGGETTLMQAPQGDTHAKYISPLHEACAETIPPVHGYDLAE